MLWRKRRSFTDRLDKQLDRDLKHIARNRLPMYERDIALTYLLRASNLGGEYNWSFRIGYGWAHGVGAFVVDLGAEDQEIVRQGAEAYVNATTSERGEVIAWTFIHSMLPPRHQFVTDKDKSPYGTPDEAFAAKVDWISTLARRPLDPHQALGVFFTRLSRSMPSRASSSCS